MPPISADRCYAEIEASTSPVDAPHEMRRREADDAQAWFKTITVETFG